MLRLPPFRYHRPRTLDEALGLLESEGSSVRLVAGGTDLWPNMKRRHQTADTVVSLMAIDELAGVANGGPVTKIGATSLLDDIVRSPHIRTNFPALARATASISSPPLRNMGTLGGNVCLDTRCTYYNQTEEWRRSIDYCLKEVGTVCWVAPGSSICWAHSASDTAPMLSALEAAVVLLSPSGKRRLSMDELYNNDGIRYLNLRPGEILVGVELPETSRAPRCRSSFWKLRRRGSIDFAVLSVAAAVWLDPSGRVEKVNVTLGSVASQPTRVKQAGEVLRGGPLEPDSIRAVASAARRAATPMDNTDFKTQWRGLMVERYTEAALREIAGLPIGPAAPPHPSL